MKFESGLAWFVKRHDDGEGDEMMWDTTTTPGQVVWGMMVQK